MSAKPSKKSANKTARSTPVAALPLSPTPVGAAAATSAGTLDGGAEVSWLDSTDPRKRMWGKIIFVGIWIYVAALWLLALDQTFHWGIFGPKVPPLP